MIKVILIILAVILVLFVIAMLIFKSFAQLNSKELKSNEIVLKGSSDKKALVIYQKSKHNTATNITMALANELNQLGYTVVINHPSSKLTYNVAEFDIFAFGSTIYFSTISESLKAYIQKCSFVGKQVIIYAIGESTEVMVEVNTLIEKIENSSKVEGIKVKKGEEEKMKSFVEKFISFNKPLEI